MVEINFKNLKIDLISDKDDLSTCDFKEKDGSDPLRVDYFIHNEALKFNENNLCRIYIVRYTDEIVAFFTVSMGSIKVQHLRVGEKVKDVGIISYPAMLLGNMGVDLKFRDRGLGSWICDRCIGLARIFNKKIGCRYVYLHTNRQIKTFYEKRGFISSENLSHEKLWMYRKISTHVIGIHETLHYDESVSIKVTRAWNDENVS